MGRHYTRLSRAPSQDVDCHNRLVSCDGGFIFAPIAGGDPYILWLPPTDTAGSTPYFCSRETSCYVCNRSKRLRVSGAVNVMPPPDVVVRAELINSVMHVCSPSC